MEQLIERINKLALPVKIGIVFAVIGALTAANYFLLVTDVETQLTSLAGRQEAANRTLAEKQAIADNLVERRKEMDLLETRFQEALTQLPERKDIEELLAQLNDVGKKSGLEIGKVTPQAEAQEGFYARIPIAMTVAGNFHEIAMFMQEIANLRRIVNVSAIRLGGPKTNNEKVTLQAEFLATTFRFSEPKAAAPKGGKGKGKK